MAGSTILYILTVDDCEDFFSKVFVSIIYFSIFVAIVLFVKSDVVCNIHMEAYEKGKLEKGYDEDCDSVYDIYGNIIDIDNYGLGIIPEYCCPAPYQAELQEWLRNEHGVSVLVYLDETLSYIWTITCLHPRASIMEYHQSNEVWCGHYEDCLEAGLQAALKLS